MTLSNRRGRRRSVVLVLGPSNVHQCERITRKENVRALKCTKGFGILRERWMGGVGTNGQIDGWKRRLTSAEKILIAFQATYM